MRTMVAMTVLWLMLSSVTQGQPPRPAERPPVDDAKVKAFLEAHRGTWRDLNVPESDGKLLYDLVVKNQYKDILEIGTSTGHSTIWLAWAASKTGGMVTTIEIDEDRHRQAVANLTEAGLQQYVDARLGDAHQLVKELKGPFDFVFSDADKEWYKNYFVDVYPKLKDGGCFTAHNVFHAQGRLGKPRSRSFSIISRPCPIWRRPSTPAAGPACPSATSGKPVPPSEIGHHSLRSNCVRSAQVPREILMPTEVQRLPGIQGLCRLVHSRLHDEEFPCDTFTNAYRSP